MILRLEFVTKFIASFYLCRILPCSMPMILRLELSQILLQVFTCVEYAHNFKAKKFTQYMAKYYPVGVVCPWFWGWSCHKIYCKYKIFVMAVYLIFKYGKRFRFAPSFDKLQIFYLCDNQINWWIKSTYANGIALKILDCKLIVSGLICLPEDKLQEASRNPEACPWIDRYLL